MKSLFKQAILIFVLLFVAIYPRTNFTMSAPLDSQLRNAILRADLSKVEEPLNKGVNPNGKDFCNDPEHEESFLIYALDQHWVYLNSESQHKRINDSLKIMKALINAGADPNFKNRYPSALKKAQTNHSAVCNLGA